MSQKKCRAAYEGRLATWAAARVPALRVAYENAPLTPLAGETYLRAYLLPAETTSTTLSGDLRTFLGVFQVSIVASINAGSGVSNGIADELAALFLCNARLTVTGMTVQQITPVSVAPALQDETNYVVPVSFQYRADTT